MEKGILCKTENLVAVVCPGIVFKLRRKGRLLYRFRRTHQPLLRVQQDCRSDDTYAQASGRPRRSSPNQKKQQEEEEGQQSSIEKSIVLLEPLWEPRVKLYMPKEDLSPIPLNYIDVTRTTYTSQDVLFKKQIDDYWNLDGERENYQMHGQASQDLFYWMKGHLTDKHGPVRDLRGNKQPSRPDNVWRQLCVEAHVWCAAKSEAKKKRAIEKSKAR